MGLWADADPDGRKHMAAMARLLAGIASSVRTVSPMGDVPTGWDAADTDVGTIARMLQAAPRSDQAAALARCVDTFRGWLHLPDAGILCVTLAAVAANRAAGDPVWLLIVAPPGGGQDRGAQRPRWAL